MKETKAFGRVSFSLNHSALFSKRSSLGWQHCSCSNSFVHDSDKMKFKQCRSEIWEKIATSCITCGMVKSTDVGFFSITSTTNYFKLHLFAPLGCVSWKRKAVAQSLCEILQQPGSSTTLRCALQAKEARPDVGLGGQQQPTQWGIMSFVKTATESTSCAHIGKIKQLVVAMVWCNWERLTDSRFMIEIQTKNSQTSWFQTK